MINVRAIANRATSGINPNLRIGYRAYAGYTKDAAYKPVPSYADSVEIVAQVQALSKKEIEHLDNLNISNATRSVYANRQISCVDRVTQSGGDLLDFEGAAWLAVAVLEGWTTAGWCKVAVARQ